MIAIASIVKRHALSLASACVLLGFILLYTVANPKTHFGSFVGNAIADWTGVVVTILATTYLYEISAKSKRKPTGLRGLFRAHTLTIFLLITGVGWTVVYLRMDPEAKWGQVMGNIVSEWTQILGLVLLTKRWIERKSRGSGGAAASSSS